MGLKKEMQNSLSTAKQGRKEGIKETYMNMGGLFSEDEASAFADATVGAAHPEVKTAEEAEAEVEAEQESATTVA